MTKLETVSFVFNDKEYLVANIPDVIFNSDKRLLIGSHSMNVALYDDEKGYISNEARYLDEQIYAYIDDVYFSMDYEQFLKNVLMYLD